MGTWSKRVILVCGVVLAGCGGKDPTPSGTDAAPDLGTAEVGADACQPNCTGKECGDDGCGGECGQCQSSEFCEADGTCHEAIDYPKCEGKECGSDGFGGSCGECTGSQDACVDGICVCQPACAPKKCGDDGCGWICGNCGPTCDCVDGMCNCGAPDCVGKECGPDGLGGLCGECVNGKFCYEGKCVGPGTDCPELGSGNCQRVMVLTVSLEANAGGGLDLDDNPGTCTPTGDCADGVDNGFAAVAETIQAFVPEPSALIETFYGPGTFLQLSSFEWELDGKAFGLAGTIGHPDASTGECEWEGGECISCVPKDGADYWSCSTPISFDNALVLDGILTAGGPDSLNLARVPAFPGVVLYVSVSFGSLQAKVVPLDGGGFRLEEGLLGGAVRKDKLMEAVDYLPDELVKEKDALKGALYTLVVPDMDTDADGEMDAISMAFRFSTLPGTSAGLCPQ